MPTIEKLAAMEYFNKRAVSFSAVRIVSSIYAPALKSDAINRYYAHGKLLISGEYLVLSGAEALAVPLKKGQWLEVEEANRKEKAMSEMECTDAGQRMVYSHVQLTGNGDRACFGPVSRSPGTIFSKMREIQQ